MNGEVNTQLCTTFRQTIWYPVWIIIKGISDVPLLDTGLDSPIALDDVT